jgi:hypothetical protein
MVEKHMGNKHVQVGVVRRFKEGWLCEEAVTLGALEKFKVEADPQIIRAACRVYIPKRRRQMRPKMDDKNFWHCSA